MSRKDIITIQNPILNDIPYMYNYKPRNPKPMLGEVYKRIWKHKMQQAKKYFGDALAKKYESRIDLKGCFIQAFDLDDAEKLLQDLKGAVVTPDLKIYPQVEYWDDACKYDMPIKTLLSLYHLQCEIEMVNDGDLEPSIDQIVEDAKALRKSWKNMLKLIKFKPLKRDEK
jgi:hypothetical protein